MSIRTPGGWGYVCVAGSQSHCAVTNVDLSWCEDMFSPSLFAPRFYVWYATGYYR